MPNSHHKQVYQVFRWVRLILVGVLLLGHTSAPSALAESYIKVWDKGVVYYYFSNRGHLQLRQPVSNPPAPINFKNGASRIENPVFIQRMDQPHNLRYLAIRAAIRLEANSIPKDAFLKDAASLMQLRLKKADDLPVINFFDLTKNIWMAPRYLGKFFTRPGWPSPLAATAPDPDSQRMKQDQTLPPIQEIRVAIQDACNNFLKNAQEQLPQLAQVKPGADPLASWNQHGYCFPVAPPFSFKDTWGDPRNGGRYHSAVDIFAYEGTPVYAITSGVIHQLAIGPEAGIFLLLRGQDGRGYGYMHLQGYAEGITEGKTVKRGEIIGYVGRTGILQSSAHLHLQVYFDHSFARDKLWNPYSLLVQLCNGKGVADLLDQKIARRRIPGVEVMNYETVRLTNFVSPKFHGGQRSRTPKLVINN